MPASAVATPPGASGLSRTSDLSDVLIKVAELIVETFVELGIALRHRLGGVRLVLTRPPDRDEPDDAGRADPDRPRQQPGQPAEPAIHRRAEHLLAAVLGDERLDDLVVRLPLIDQRGELSAHVVRRAARILAALPDSGVAAAARADDLVLQLLFERA